MTNSFNTTLKSINAIVARIAEVEAEQDVTRNNREYADCEIKLQALAERLEYLTRELADCAKIHAEVEASCSHRVEATLNIVDEYRAVAKEFPCE